MEPWLSARRCLEERLKRHVTLQATVEGLCPLRVNTPTMPNVNVRMCSDRRRLRCEVWAGERICENVEG